MPFFDYLVLKPRDFQFSDGEVRRAEIGDRISGVEAEAWGNGRAVDHLVSNGILAPVPHEAEGDVADSATPKEFGPHETQSFPIHKGFGKYELSDGSVVEGKDAARAAQDVLDAEGDV